MERCGGTCKDISWNDLEVVKGRYGFYKCAYHVDEKEVVKGGMWIEVRGQPESTSMGRLLDLVRLVFTHSLRCEK